MHPPPARPPPAWARKRPAENPSVAIEGRLRDGATGEVLFLFADREESQWRPVDLKSVTWWGHAKGIIEDWARQCVELANTLTGPQLSDETRMVLARYGLDELQQRSPDLAVTRLHERACQETRRDVLFALAETSYAAGQRYQRVTWTNVHSQDTAVTLPGKQAAHAYYAASAVYAYLYLFGEGLEAPPDPFDRRFRVACDLYNRGLARALKRETDDTVDLAAQELHLPQGSVHVESTRPGFPWSAALKKLGGKVPTSVANMNPNNPLLNRLHDLPLADGLQAHSIIAVKPGLAVETGNDGVVAYSSAHLDGVESEYIVRFEHTCQNQPLAIEEIRRILLLHLK